MLAENSDQLIDSGSEANGLNDTFILLWHKQKLFQLTNFVIIMSDHFV